MEKDIQKRISLMERYVIHVEGDLVIECFTWDLDAYMTGDAPQTTPLHRNVIISQL